MDCRETQASLTAFHDGELPGEDRVRMEMHLRGCLECRALLSDLARADQAAGVPDPGPAYWERFNARVLDRITRETDDHGWSSAGTGKDASGFKAPTDQGVAVLRPKHGWMRQQLRYLVPAAAAAALVVGIVRYGGMPPDLPSRPMAKDGQVPGQAGMPRALEPRPAVREPAATDPAGQRKSKVEPETDGHGWPSAGAGKDAADSVATAAGSPPVSAEEGMTPAMQAERKKMAESADRRTERKSDGQGWPSVGAGRDAPGFEAPTGHGWPSAGAGRDATGSVDPTGKAKSAPGVRIAKETSAVSPCERARSLAGRERFREAEDAQRACLAGDLSAPSREKGLVFLAELLDRQARFAEADAVIAEVDRKFPQSPPLERYRRQRPMVQKRPMTVPVTR